MSLLEVTGLGVSYGDMIALEDVSIQVETGEAVTVLGANAAGKSTLLRAISGLVPARAEGVTVLIVEQNVHQTLKIADRGYVLQNGRLKLSGTADELAASDEVRRAYLGM